MWPRLFQGQFVVRKLHTKFEVSTFTHYEDMKGNEKIGVVWGLVVTQG